MLQPLRDILTVIIPTRDRADTLKHALRTVTAQTSPNIEIIVSDNFSGPEVKAVVDNVSDQRLRYIRTPERLGMSEHWEFALAHATGNWVTILGDDDGLVLGAVERFFAMVAKHPEVKAITSANCWYRWPAAADNGKEAKLVMIGSSGYEVRDSRKALEKCLKGDVISLPTIYTGGFIHIDIIKKAKQLSPQGVFFHSIIPDFYSGMAVASLSEKYIYCYEPWGVAGSSRYSNGQQQKNKSKDAKNKLSFFTENKMKFHPMLGGGYMESTHMLQYECFLQSQHLRNYTIDTSLEEQLVISMVRAGRRIKHNFAEFCEEVARINDLDVSIINKKARLRKPLYRAGKLTRKLTRNIPGMNRLPVKSVPDSSLSNVYDASVRAAKILGW